MVIIYYLLFLSYFFIFYNLIIYLLEDRTAPVEGVLSLGIVPRLIQILEWDHKPVIKIIILSFFIFLFSFLYIFFIVY